MGVHSFQNIVTTEKETSLSSCKNVDFFLLYMKITPEKSISNFRKVRDEFDFQDRNVLCKRFTPALRIGPLEPGWKMGRDYPQQYAIPSLLLIEIVIFDSRAHD